MITLNVPNNILFIFCYFLADSANVYFGPLLIFCQNTRRSEVGIYLVVLQKHQKSIISVNSQRNGLSSLKSQGYLQFMGQVFIWDRRIRLVLNEDPQSSQLYGSVTICTLSMCLQIFCLCFPDFSQILQWQSFLSFCALYTHNDLTTDSS